MSIQVFLPQDEIFGKRYEDWIAYFWNNFGTKRFWLRGPVFICPGKIPDQEIANTVNKLYGFGTSKTVIPDHRKFKIDSNKAILFSPMCMFQAAPKSEPYNKEDLKSFVHMRMTNVGPINITLDGHEIRNKLVRVATDIFTLDGKYDAVSDGYWLFIKPDELEDGIHTINAHAICAAGTTKVPNYITLDIRDNGSAAANWLFNDKPQVSVKERG
jgi:hypothetical protein